jgi:glycyl-tRNA synthetase beta chain
MKDVLIEVGVEELPARFVDLAETQLKEKTAAWLEQSRISYRSLTSYSTPRRFTVMISEIGEAQTTVEEEVRGPALSIAKDEEGNWTKAAIGFAKGQGKTVEDLVGREVNGKSYVFLSKKIEGKNTDEILPEFKEIIESIQFGSNMRWGTESLRYARPIRWITAIYGQQVIPFEIANVQTDNVTYGHRYLGSEVAITDASQYEEILRENFCIVDAKKREKMILEGIKEIEKEKGYQIIVEKDLLDEVRNLVEYPTVFIGSFEEGFLNLPQEVLIISMKEHQRYFPVKSQDNELLPYFIGVRNGDRYSLENVVKGNEKVLRARLADAEFFFEEDQKHSIDFYSDKLKRVVFQEKLGTTADKVQRVTHIAEKIADQLELDSTVRSHIIRAVRQLPTGRVRAPAD